VEYPSAVLLMPLSNLWAVLFFIMMVLIGIGSVVPQFLIISDYIYVNIPVGFENFINKKLNSKFKRWHAVITVILFIFTLSLLLNTTGG